MSETKNKTKNVPNNSIVDLARTITTDLPAYTSQQKQDIQAHMNYLINAPLFSLTPQEIALRYELRRLEAYDKTLASLPGHVSNPEFEKLAEKAITLVMETFEPYYSARKPQPKNPNPGAEIGETISAAISAVFKGVKEMENKGTQEVTVEAPWEEDYYNE